MEIHAPEKPILTIKEAIVHLGIVTAGILIALSLEAIVEYAHHRTVVREAREIMKSEIEENLKDLNETMGRIMLQQDGLRKGIKIFSAMAKGEKPKIEGLRWMLNYRTADLHTAGHSTAELMGAFVYMDYREVSRYAAIYDVPKQNTMGLPASSVSLDGSQFKFEMNINPAKFVATVDAAKSTITGTWTQGDHDQPLVLSRQSKSR